MERSGGCGQGQRSRGAVEIIGSGELLNPSFRGVKVKAPPKRSLDGHPLGDCAGQPPGAARNGSTEKHLRGDF
jgi:hypothetical protein